MDTSTQLAIERTRLAADRTQMAWIRTAFSMISFGFSVFKFFEYLRLAGMLPAGAGHLPRNFGLLLIVIGTLALVAATWQHRASWESWHASIRAAPGFRFRTSLRFS